MKKEYFKVYIRDEYNRCLEANCEVVCKTSGSTKTGAYIFRDLISQKLILPNYGHPLKENESTLTYNNYDKESFHKISGKDVLSFLKEIDMSYIEEHQQYLNNLENKIIEKSLVRRLDLEQRHLQQ